MFIEKIPGRPQSPFMGERQSVALLKELPDLNSVFYKHFTATRFLRQPRWSSGYYKHHAPSGV